MSRNNKVAILVLGTADWDQPIATNQHYAVRELAREFDVAFVESMGLRRLEISKRDLKRIVTRLRSPASKNESRPVPERAQVLSPLTIPIHQAPFTFLNRVLLRNLVADWLSNDGKRVLWTYSPVTYGLERNADVVVYHCVDLLSEVPGISKSVIRRAERKLARSEAVAAGSSDVVVSHLASRGFKHIEDWPNVADVERVITAGANRGERNLGAIFAGNLSSTKIDFGILASLLSAGVPVQLAGPISEGGGDARADVSKLVELGAVYHGALSFERLTQLYMRCSIGLVPYRINSYTYGVSPLKTFEYLAAGLSVVSTPVPAVTIGPDVAVEETQAGFVAQTLARLNDTGDANVKRRQDEALKHTWSGRGAAMRQLVTSQIAAGTNA